MQLHVIWFPSCHESNVLKGCSLNGLKYHCQPCCKQSVWQELQASWWWCGLLLPGEVSYVVVVCLLISWSHACMNVPHDRSYVISLRNSSLKKIKDHWGWIYMPNKSYSITITYFFVDEQFLLRHKSDSHFLPPCQTTRLGYGRMFCIHRDNPWTQTAGCRLEQHRQANWTKPLQAKHSCLGQVGVGE